MLVKKIYKIPFVLRLLLSFIIRYTILASDHNMSKHKIHLYIFLFELCKIKVSKYNKNYIYRYIDSKLDNMASYRGDTYDRYEHSDPRDARISTHRSAYPSHSYSDSRHDQPRNYSEMPIGDSLPYAQPPSRPTDPRVRPSARADPPGHDIDQPLIQRSVPEKSGYDSPLKRNFDPRQEEYRRDQYDKHDQIRAGHGYTDNAGVGQPMADAHYRHRVAEPYYDERGHDRRSHEKSAERREEPREDNSKGSSKLPWFEHELQVYIHSLRL